MEPLNSSAAATPPPEPPPPPPPVDAGPVGQTGSSDATSPEVAGVRTGAAAPPKNDRDLSRFEDARPTRPEGSRIGPTGNAKADPPKEPTAESRYNQAFRGVQTGTARSSDTDRTAYSGRGATVTTNTTNNNGAVRTETQNSHVSKAGNDTRQKPTSTTADAKPGGLKVNNNSRTQLLDPNVAKVERGDTNHTASRTYGNTTFEAHARGPSLTLSGNAYAAMTGSGLQRGMDLHVDAKVDANLVSGGGSATHDYKFSANGHDYTLRMKLGADGAVGMNGTVKLDLHAGLDGAPRFTVGAEGFAGAQGKLSGDMRLIMDGDEAHPMMQGDLSLSAGAGAGAAYELSAGVDHFHARAMAYAGAGVGAELNGHVNWTEMSNAALPRGQVMPWDARAQWWGPLNQLQFWQKH